MGETDVVLPPGEVESIQLGTPLFASVGSTLFSYVLSVDSGGLELRDSLQLAEGIQYAWPAKSGRFDLR